MFHEEELFDSDNVVVTESEEDENDDLGIDDVVDPETWQGEWAEELVTLYHIATDHAASMGWSILDRCTFHDWATFCFEKSSKRPPAA